MGSHTDLTSERGHMTPCIAILSAFEMVRTHAMRPRSPYPRDSASQLNLRPTKIAEAQQ